MSEVCRTISMERQQYFSLVELLITAVTTICPEKSTLTAGNSDIRFLPTGQTANGLLTLTLKADDCDHHQERNIIITRQGHTTVTERACTR